MMHDGAPDRNRLSFHVMRGMTRLFTPIQPILDPAILCHTMYPILSFHRNIPHPNSQSKQSEMDIDPPSPISILSAPAPNAVASSSTGQGNRKFKTIKGYVVQERIGRGGFSV